MTRQTRKIKYKTRNLILKVKQINTTQSMTTTVVYRINSYMLINKAKMQLYQKKQ